MPGAGRILTLPFAFFSRLNASIELKLRTRSAWAWPPVRGQLHMMSLVASVCSPSPPGTPRAAVISPGVRTRQESVSGCGATWGVGVGAGAGLLQPKRNRVAASSGRMDLAFMVPPCVDEDGERGDLRVL